jgi:hypothetical protein
MIVGSTADILALLGGSTTLIAALFASIRLSRCQSISCCWGGVTVVNRPIPLPIPLVAGAGQPIEREGSAAALAV